METSKLKGHVPESVLKELEAIDLSPLKAAHFLAQCDHESGRFKSAVENLNYSDAGLLKTFPKYFNSLTAKQYERQPAKIANRVYANRMGNGDEVSGDGYKFRGRGFLMLTGLANYEAFGRFIQIDLLTCPDLVAKEYALRSAYWFFAVNSIWDKCVDATNKSVLAVTKAVNGGTNGLEERIRLFKKYWALLS